MGTDWVKQGEFHLSTHFQGTLDGLSIFSTYSPLIIPWSVIPWEFHGMTELWSAIKCQSLKTRDERAINTHTRTLSLSLSHTHTHTHTHIYKCIYIYIYIYISEGHTISFHPFFFVREFKIVVDSRKFTMLLLYVLWDDRSIFLLFQVQMNSNSSKWNTPF